VLIITSSVWMRHHTAGAKQYDYKIQYVRFTKRQCGLTNAIRIDNQDKFVYQL